MEHIDNAAFARVGLDPDREQARRLAAALTIEAADVRARFEPDDPPSWWAAAAVARVLDPLSRCQLGDLVAGLGLGRASFRDPDRGDRTDPTRALLRHLLRDRLIDLLRVSAGERPYWRWEADGRYAPAAGVAPAAPPPMPAALGTTRPPSTSGEARATTSSGVSGASTASGKGTTPLSSRT